MTRLGADVAALDDLARTFALGCHRLADTDRQVDALLRTTWWEGPDRQAFEPRVRHLRDELHHAAELLADTARTIAHQVTDQRAASSADGFAAPGGGRPGPVVSPSTTTDALRRLPVDPAAVRRAWSGLSADQRAWAIASVPDLVGNRDGIPPADRIAANRRRIERDLAGATGARRRLLQSWLDPQTDPVTGGRAPSQVLLYDPVAEHAAVAWGDLAAADDVVVEVPGTGTTIASYAGGAHPGIETTRARAVYGAAHRSSGARVAVVGWLGYDAPQWDLDHSPALSEAGIEGGDDLARFTDGLGLASDQRLSLIGHSYGSFVVGEALRSGAKPVNVVVLGSPGLGVDDADELHLQPGADLFAVRAPLDPVGGLQRFGTDPTDPSFGATRLSADAHGQLFSHSTYWEGSNLDQLAAAVTDGDVHVQVLPTTGEVVGRAVTRTWAAPDRLIDAVQDELPLPEAVDHAVDVLQRPGKAVTGVAATVTSEVVDGTVEGAKGVYHWLTD